MIYLAGGAVNVPCREGVASSSDKIDQCVTIFSFLPNGSSMINDDAV